MPRIVVRAFASLLVVALAACDGLSEPEGVEGRYAVYTVNGDRPPAVLLAPPGGGRTEAVDATLLLRAPDQVAVELATRVVGPDGTPGPVNRVAYAGTYKVEGGFITMGRLEAADGRGADAEGVVISPREVAVTLEIPAPPSQGLYTYPVALVLRR